MPAQDNGVAFPFPVVPSSTAAPQPLSSSAAPLAPPHAAPAAGGSDGHDGVPFWAGGLRDDIRGLRTDISNLGRDFRQDVQGLGQEFRSGIRTQTVALLGLALAALAVNSALVLQAMKLSAPGVQVETSRQGVLPAAPVAPPPALDIPAELQPTAP